MRVAVYVRISLDRAGEGLGVERQREDCAALAERRGWAVAGTFVDNDRSAAGRKPRPEFMRLLAEVRKGQYGAIVAWSLDRLTRTARDRLALIEACQQNGTIIALVRGSDIDLTTPAGRLTAGILGEVAQHEIDAKSDRQRRAAQQAAEQGRRVGGRRPFGYDQSGATVVPHEADAIRSGYRALLAGTPLRAIADEWNAAGLRTGQAPWRHTHLGDASPWRTDSVRRVLSNPRYAGIRAHNGEERSVATWEALVPMETFRAAQAVLSDRSRVSGGRGTAGRQLLTGLALCGNADCGRRMHGGGASHRKPVYRCSSDAESRLQPKAPGRHPNRLAEPIDAYVRDVVVARLSRADARDLLADYDRPDVEDLRAESTSLRRRLEGLAADFATETEVSLAEYRSMTRTVRERLTVVEAGLADAGRVSLLGDLVGAEDVAAAWDALQIDRRRAVIAELMDIRVHIIGRGVRTFRPESVDINWKIY